MAKVQEALMKEEVQQIVVHFTEYFRLQLNL